VQTTTTLSHILSLLLYNHIHKMTGSRAFHSMILLTYIQHRLNNGWHHNQLIKTCYAWPKI